MTAAPMSTVDLKLALFRREVLEVYAADRGVDLTPRPVCSRCRTDILPGDTFADCDDLCPQRAPS